MRGPDSVFPRHVRACQHSPDCRERWFVWTWLRANGENKTRIPYSCNSWRCDVCRRHEAAVTFARLKEAVERRGADGKLEADPTGWCTLVLTLDQRGYYSGEPWRDVNQAYAALGKMSRSALDRIGREFGSETRTEVREYTSKKTGKTTTKIRHVRHVGNRWYSVVEAHKSGWPHLNLVVWCPALAAELRREQAERLEDDEIANALALAREAWKRKETVPEHVRELARKAILAGGRVLELIEDAGWGRQSTAEPVRDLDALLAYTVKLAGHHDAAIGEVAKVTQCPMAAPERFRRLRAGKGFLPPRHSNPEVTGCMMRRRRSAEGDWELERINPPSDVSVREAVAAYRADGVDISPEEEAEMCARYLERQTVAIAEASAAELALIDEEERLLSRGRGKLPAMPPLRRARGAELEGHRETSERRAALDVRHRAHAHPIGLSVVELEQQWRDAAAAAAAQRRAG